MKEATGELDSTIVIVLVVGALITFFYFTVWPMIRGSLKGEANCRKAICEPCNNPNNDCDFVTCHVKGDSAHTFECIYKG